MCVHDKECHVNVKVTGGQITFTSNYDKKLVLTGWKEVIAWTK